MTVINNMLASIGHTPVLSLSHLLPEGSAKLFVKLEGYNPGGSIKDRPALNMINNALDKGLLKPNGTIVESTSGNLGVALAMISAIRGFRCIIVVDPRTSLNNVAMIKAFGAEVDVVTEKNPIDGTYQEARIRRTKYLAETIPGAYMPYQYGNPANPAAHVNTTATEILNDFTNGPDSVVIAVSTAGQITGIARGLKEQNAKTKIIGVDVKGSVVFGGEKGPTAVTGMGLGWVPENLDPTLIDEAYLVETQHCFSTSRLIAKKFGVLLGGSSGASLFVAINQAMKMSQDKTVLAIASDRGEKYLQEFYNDSWMKEKNLDITDDFSYIINSAKTLNAYRYPSAEPSPKAA